MITSDVKTYVYPNGELQRVQWVRPGSWDEIGFLFPEPDGTAFDCFCNIYRNYLIPKFPWIFGRYTLTDGTRAQKISGRLPFRKTIRVSDTAGRLTELYPQAAVKMNASFFIMDPFDVLSPYDKVGMPFGLMVKNGKVLNPPLYERETLFVGDDGRVSVRIPKLRELEISIGETVYKIGKNAEAYSRPEHRKAPPVRSRAMMDIVIVGRRVEDISYTGKTRIPGAGFILRTARTDEVAVGDEVTYRGMEQVKFAVQCGNSTVIDGVKTDTFRSRFYNIRKPSGAMYPPCLYPADFEKARAARTAIGSDEEGKPLLIWAEGAPKNHYDPGADSCGASLAEFSGICKDLGMISGINLDGGGSAQILLHNKRSLKLTDRAEDGITEMERSVPCGLIFM